MSRLQSAFQLANERERTALETAEAARQMVEKALEEEAKAKEMERKAQAIYAKATEKAMFAEKKQRMWKFVCILSWIFFVIVMLFLLLLLCFGSIEFSRVKRPRLLP